MLVWTCRCLLLIVLIVCLVGECICNRVATKSYSSSLTLLLSSGTEAVGMVGILIIHASDLFMHLSDFFGQQISVCLHQFSDLTPNSNLIMFFTRLPSKLWAPFCWKALTVV